MNGRFLLNRRDGKIMGVAAGIGDVTGVDPLLIRLAIVVATLITGPVLMWHYLIPGGPAWPRSARGAPPPLISSPPPCSCALQP
jgi:phage shock protein C